MRNLLKNDNTGSLRMLPKYHNLPSNRPESENFETVHLQYKRLFISKYLVINLWEICLILSIFLRKHIKN